MTRRGRALAVLVTVVAALLSGCGSDSGTPAEAPATSSTPTPTPTPTPELPERPACAADADGHYVTVTTTEGETAGVLIIGTGTRGVVLGPQDDGDICQWLPYATELATRYRIALFDWADPRAELPALAVRALRDAGAREVVLGGASFGGATAMSEAYAVRPRLAGVVSLGGELTLPGGFDFRPGIRQWQGPLLQISSDDDHFFGSRDVPRLRALHPGPEEVLMLPGHQHGVELLDGPDQVQVRAAIGDFLSDVLG